MKREYLTFVDSPEHLAVGQEIELTVKDLTPGPGKYDAHNVRAIVSNLPNQLQDGDTLWLRSKTGFLYPEPWAIKITADLGEYIPKGPYSDIKFIRFPSQSS